MTKINSYEFRDIYERMGITTEGMGVVMLDTPGLAIREHIENFSEDEIFYANDPKRRYLGGIPGENIAHVTLLYGLMSSARTWKPYVDMALDGWMPEPLRVGRVTTFPAARSEEQYTVIIAELELTPNLLEGHQRLQLLPHIDTFPNYRAHITLAYVKNQPANVDWAITTHEKWVRCLREEFEGKTIEVTGINYGSEQ